MYLVISCLFLLTGSRWLRASHFCHGEHERAVLLRDEHLFLSLSFSFSSESVGSGRARQRIKSNLEKKRLHNNLLSYYSDNDNIMAPICVPLHSATQFYNTTQHNTILQHDATQYHNTTRYNFTTRHNITPTQVHTTNTTQPNPTQYTTHNIP